MTHGERTTFAYPSIFSEWSRLVQKLTGDITFCGGDEAKKAITPRVDVSKVPVPEQYQGAFGTRARVRVFGAGDTGYQVGISSGLFTVRRHAVYISPAPGGAVEAPAELMAEVTHHSLLRASLSPVFMPELPEPALRVPLHAVADPYEAQMYTDILEAAAAEASAQGLNVPRMVMVGRPAPLSPELFE